MKLAWTLVAVVAALCVARVAAEYETEDGIVVLTNDNFADYISENDNVLVEFYAPWCGHCKKLAPEYKKAAEELQNEPPLAKVDCTEEKAVCEEHGVRGYPTLKYFSNGKPSDYEGGRTAGAITKWLRSRLLPAVSEVADKDAFESFKSTNDLVVVAFYAADDEETASTVSTVAEGLRDDASFAAVTDADLIKELGIESLPALKLFRTFDQPEVSFEGEIVESSVGAWVVEKSFALVGEIGPENYRKYMERGLPLLWIAVDTSDDNDMQIVEFAKNVAADFTSELSFVYVDGVKFQSHIKSLGLSGETPGVIITATPKKYIHAEDETITEDSLRAFVTGYSSGELTPFLKSQEIPEENDEPVTVVVGKSFDDIVMKSEADVLVEFYAPWCGHCKKLAPIYDSLGEEYADDEGVVIAKMDSTENDGPIDISGFPTLIFFPAGDKENHIRYSGDRTQEAISAFIKENGKFSTSAQKEEL